MGAGRAPGAAGLQTKRGWGLGIAHQNKGTGRPWLRPAELRQLQLPLGASPAQGGVEGDPGPTAAQAPAPRRVGSPVGDVSCLCLPTAPSPQQGAEPGRVSPGRPQGLGCGGITAAPTSGTPLQAGGATTRPIPRAVGRGCPVGWGVAQPWGDVGCRARGPGWRGCVWVPPGPFPSR